MGDRRPRIYEIARHRTPALPQTLKSRRHMERNAGIEEDKPEPTGAAGMWGTGTYHGGAVLDGLLGVEGAVLPGDALADHAGALVHEHRRRRRGRGRRREAPRVEEGRPRIPAAGTRGGRRRPWWVAGGGSGGRRRRRVPLFSSRFDFVWGFWASALLLRFCLLFWGLLAIHSCRGSWVVKLST